MFDYIRYLFRNRSISALGVRSSAEYRKVMKEYAETHKTCEFCGNGGRIEIHHKIPVSVAPELAADKNNLIALHKKPNCHLVVGHLGNYKNYNKQIDGVCLEMKRGRNDINKTI